MAIAETPSTWEGENVDVTTLEGRLASLWKDVVAHNSSAPAVRTHIFNLVVYTDDTSRARHIEEQVERLGQMHPSRTILLVASRGDPQSGVDAQLHAQCTPPTKELPAFCHERVTLRVHGRAADHLSSVAIPLLIPQLPTYLWWPGQPLFGHRLFHRLLSVADQLVVDSAQFASPGDGLADLASLCRQRQGVNDFNWTRLMPWRELVAQFFDGADMAPYARGIRSMRFEFGSGGTDSARAASSLLLVLGWMASQLGWEPETTLERVASSDISLAVTQQGRVIPIELCFRDHGKRLAGRLYKLEIHAQRPEQPDARYCITRSEEADQVDVEAQVAGEALIRRVVPLTLKSDLELLTEELGTVGHDVLYDKVVLDASRMAGREVWVTA